jgi:hypothetical protein
MASKVYDRGAPNNGVIIHDVQMGRARIGGGCYFNNQSGWAIPIDATDGDFDSLSCSPMFSQGQDSGGSGLGNAQFGVGQIYSDATHGIKVKVKTQTATGFIVNVIRSK